MTTPPSPATNHRTADTPENHVTTTDPAEVMADAIEHALWQNLADALTRIEDWGLDPIAGLCEQFGARPVTVIDAGPVIHGGGVRAGGYLLRLVESTWTVDPRPHDEPPATPTTQTA